MKKKILITGGAGFIGFHLARAIQKEGHHITILDNLSRNDSDPEFENLIDQENVHFFNVDLTQKLFYGHLSDYYDEIYHLAAINGTKYFYEKPYEVLRVNILSLLNMIEWVDSNNTGKFLFTSSSETYAGTINRFGSLVNYIPTNEDIPLCIDEVFNERFSYGGSKLAGELLTINYFKKLDVPFSIVRYHNIYGPRMGFEHVIPEFCKRIYTKADPFVVFGGEVTRAFCYIADAIKGTLLAMRNSNTDNQILHIGNSDEEVKIIDLAQLMLKLTDLNVSIKVNEAPIGSVQRRCPDVSKIKKITGYSCKVTLEEGLRKTLDWYLTQFEEIEPMSKY